ncbi:tRNA-specific adenosine deaminase [compost metagenome]
MDPKQGAAGTIWNLTDDPRLNHRVEVIAGVLEQECGELLRAFFRGEDGQNQRPVAGPSEPSEPRECETGDLHL